MSHLSLETIARLVEDTPGTEEAAHLESCAGCRAELESMTEDVHALSLLPDMEAAPDQWEALERRLADEGIIRTRRRFGGTTRFAQIAAAILIFASGAAAVRLADALRAPTIAQLPMDPATPSLDASQRGAPAGAGVNPASAEPPAPAKAQAHPNPTLASSDARAASGAQAGSIEAAAAQVRETEQLYLSALTRYAELAMQSETGDPIARAAAMQSIVMTTQAALTQLPTDPVINGYHLTALAQRDAALRQVAANTSDRWY